MDGTRSKISSVASGVRPNRRCQISVSGGFSLKKLVSRLVAALVFETAESSSRRGARSKHYWRHFRTASKATELVVASIFALVALCSAPNAWACPTSITDNFSAPSALAFDQSGNLYVAVYNERTVCKVSPSGVVSPLPISLNQQVAGLAVDSTGNLFIADSGDGLIKKMTPNGLVVTNFSVGLDSPNGLAFDGSDKLFATSSFGKLINKFDSNGVPSTFVTGLVSPYNKGLAFDALGNLYVAESLTGEIKKITPQGGVSSFATGLSNPQGLAFDSFGNLYVANSSGDSVSKITPSGVVSTPFTTGFDGPAGLAFDAAGNLYVSNFNGDTISKLVGVALPATPVPTLSKWALMALGLLLGGVAVAGLARRGQSFA